MTARTMPEGYKPKILDGMPDGFPIIMNNNLIVKGREVKDVTTGGIILPQTVKELDEQDVQAGQIVAMGDMCFDEARFAGQNIFPVLGDYVLCAKWEGEPVKIFGQIYRIYKDSQIRGILADLYSVERPVY